MAETALTNAQAEALWGTTPTADDFEHPTPGDDMRHKSPRQELRLRLMAACSDQLRVFKDGDLTCGIRAGKWWNGGTLVEKAQADTQALSDDDTSYVYYTMDGTLTINTTGFPAYATTPHIRLATVATGSESAAAVSGNYAYTDITDYRKAALIGEVSGGVEANTAVAASANVLTAGESGKLFTNEGVGALNCHTLPTAVAGYNYTFVVQDANGIKVTAAAADTIRVGGVVSKAAGYVTSTTVGDSLTIASINATEWVATSIIGTWTVETA